MIRPDFSDIQKNGFRINQFRLIHSMSSKAFNNLKEGYVSSGNLIMERDVVMKYMTESNEINFTAFYVTLRLMFLFVFATIISLLSQRASLFLTLMLASLSIILFFKSRKSRLDFFMGDVGINFAENIYNSKINSKYNF
jgi:hypothetical protein